eukprot:jgi/Chrzof1/12472/Cz06g35170.t1
MTAAATAYQPYLTQHVMELELNACSLFAVEVLHRNGVQFFEPLVYCVATGTLCLLVFRGIAGLQFGAIWAFTENLPTVDYRHVAIGMLAGVISAVVAIGFIHMHKGIKWALSKLGLDEHRTPVMSGLTGGLLLGLIGAFLPPTLFWGEFEIRTIADPSIPLQHIWPKGGYYAPTPFLHNHSSCWVYFLIALAKLFTISLTVTSGFRGGFIFPLFFTGAALGRGMHMLATQLGVPFIGSLPTVLISMCTAAGLNTAITRTPFATALILTTLCGQPQVAAPTLCAALVSFFLTMDWPFIRTQQNRSDLEYKAVHFGEANDGEEPEPVIGTLTEGDV